MSRNQPAESARRAHKAGTICLVLGFLSGLASIAWLFLFFNLPRDSWEFPSPAAPLLLILFAGIVFTLGIVLRVRAEKVLRILPLTFLTPEEEDQVLAAIRSFESRTSGEIRVHLEASLEGELLEQAQATFERIGMTKTAQRNAVLFFVVVDEHRFAVLGDQGIDEKVAEDFWRDCVARVRERFSERRYAEGLVEGIEIAGAALAEYFPIQPDDVNELPDGISR